MRNAISSLGLCCLAVACSGAVDDSTGTQTSGQTQTPADPVNFSISLTRTTCFGTCPAYTITVDSSGSLEFEGRDFVESAGTYQSTVTPEVAEAAWDALVEIDFWSLKDNYASMNAVGCPEERSDNPSATIEAAADGDSWSVLHYYGCRGNPTLERLSELERELDDLLGSAQWIGEPDF